MAEFIPAYEGDEPYIFVSYAHKDSELVLDVLRLLYGSKYRVWYDEGIAPGSEWPKNIADHLDGCNTFLAFISSNSLSSHNCENEVISAKNNKKHIVQYSLERDKVHPLLEKDAPVADTDSLLASLDKALIGDGVSGYGRELSGIKKAFSVWNTLLGFAVLLFLAFGVVLYGLNDGWFDQYLPGRSDLAEPVSTAQPHLEDESDPVDIGDSLLGEAILQTVGKEELTNPVSFASEAQRTTFLNILEMPEDTELTYGDLTAQHGRTEIDISDATDELLALLPYFPDLTGVRLHGESVTSLQALTECPKLETVYLDQSCFPLELPQQRNFSVYLAK